MVNVCTYHASEHFNKKTPVKLKVMVELIYTNNNDFDNLIENIKGRKLKDENTKKKKRKNENTKNWIYYIVYYNLKNYKILEM
jgi:hypothetical protein